MSERIDWVQAHAVAPVIFGPDDEAADGETPSGSDSTSLMGVGIGGSIIYGEPGEIVDLFRAAIALLEEFAAAVLDEDKDVS